MKNLKRVFIFITILFISLGLCSCNDESKNQDNKETNIKLIDLSCQATSKDEGLFILSSTENVFKENININNIEAYVHYIGDDDFTKVVIKDVSIKYLDKIQSSFKAVKEYDSISVKVDENASITGEALCGYTDNVFNNLGVLTDIESDVKTIKEMLSKGVLDYGASVVSAGISAYNVLAALGMVKTKQKSQMQEIQIGIAQLSNQVDALDKKLDAVYDKLKDELDKINQTTKETLRLSYAEGWSNFKTDYLDKNGGIYQQINKFNSNYSTNFCNFTNKTNGQYSIYYDTLGNVTKPYSSIAPESGDWMSIDNTVINIPKTITFNIDENTFAQSRSFAIKSIDNETFFNAFKNDLTNALSNVNDNTKEIEVLVEDALSSISLDCTIETLNMSGENGLLADDIIDNFLLLCERLCDNKLNPIDCYHKLITTNYNFQDEAKEEIDAFNRYILYTLAQGSIYSELAVKFSSVMNNKKELVRPAADDFVKFFDGHDGYVEEKEGMKYCYVTNSYVALNQHDATFKESIKCHFGQRVFFVSGVYDSYTFNIGWSTTPQNVISTMDLKEIYADYVAMYACGLVDDNFKDYLMTNLSKNSINKDNIKNYNAVGLISGSSFGSRTFNLDGSTKLMAYSDVFDGTHEESKIVSAVCYFTKGKEFKIGTEFSDSDANKEYFAVHSSIYGDVMDLEKNVFYDDEQLISAAMYIDAQGYYLVDELWEFGGVCNLTNMNLWSKISYDEYGDPTKYPSANYNSYLHYTLECNATFWSIEKVLG